MHLEPLPPVPHQDPLPHLEQVIEAVNDTIVGALEGLLISYGQWLALIAPFLIALLVLEWVLKGIGVNAGVLRAREDMDEDLQRQSIARMDYRPTRESWH